MNVLFADLISEARLHGLRQLGHLVLVEPALEADDLPRRIHGVDVLVVRSTRVTAVTLEAADRLCLVVRAGAGTDNIDLAVASNLGIYVCNVPARNAVAVAELTMGLLLAVDRRIADNVVDSRAGRWNKGIYSRSEGILGRTLALIGLGEIGLAMAERAKAFGLTITALRRDGRSRDTEGRIRNIGIRLVNGYEELLGGADIVSLHLPGSAETYRMVDATFLGQMNDGAILLNTSRGDLVDESALLSALDAKGLRAGLDVWVDEPAGLSGSFSSALARHPRVVGTHHIGASTNQAQESVAEGTIEVIEAFLAGRVVNCVNLAPEGLGTSCVTIRHLDRVGVLAQVFAVLRANGLNVQNMQNQIFAGANAAVATINLDGQAWPHLIDDLRSIEHVLSVGAVL